ncbi:MAG: protein-glutamate O-methyltransferase CheR [Rhodospirillaceae bacterium]
MISEACAYEDIRGWLNARCGISYSDRKKDLLRLRLSRVMSRFNINSAKELAGRLICRDSREIQLAVLHAASTNHTYFFREPQVLDVFRDQILPSLAGQRELRIWSAAASSGDEAYTIAILAAETLGRERAASRVSILGTDISAPMIERAEEGVYNANHLEKTQAHLIKRYFLPQGGEQFQVSPDIRQMCTFRRMNLQARPYPFQRNFHVTFCRNVLYYFDRPHQISVLENLYDVTEPGGWLLTSMTEQVRDLGTRWKPQGVGIYRKMA